MFQVSHKDTRTKSKFPHPMPPPKKKQTFFPKGKPQYTFLYLNDASHHKLKAMIK